MALAFAYKIAIINYKYDRDGIDARYFASKSTQKSYFDTLISNQSAAWSSVQNLPINDNITINLTYNETSGRDIESLLKCNYAIIKKYNTATEAEIENSYRYFYIVAISQTNNNQIKVILDLDDIQSNFIGNVTQSKFPKCMINRAHCNRWIQYSDSASYDMNFNNTDNLVGTLSANFIKEDVEEPSLAVKSYNKMNLKVSSDSIYTEYHSGSIDNGSTTVVNDKTLNDWLSTYVIGWRYTYVTAHQEYAWTDNAADNTSLPECKIYKGYFNEKISLGVSVFVTPIFKSDASIKIINPVDGEEYDFSEYALEAFKSRNNGYAYIYQTKILKTSPFAFLAIEEITGHPGVYNFTIQGSTLKLRGQLGYTVNVSPICRNYIRFQDYTTNAPIDSCMAILSGINVDLAPTFDVTLPNTWKFTMNKSSIQLDASVKTEPKIYTNKFRLTKVKLYDGTEFDIDWSKYQGGLSGLTFTLYESFSMDLTRSYIFCKTNIATSGNNPVINPSLNYRDYLGLFSKNDTSLPMVSDNLQEMLANNKNFFNAFNMNQTVNGMKTFMTLLKGDASGSDKYNALMGGYFSRLTSEYNKQYTLDNLASSPDVVKNSAGDMIFNMAVNEWDVYVTHMEAQDSDEQLFFAMINSKGYKLGRIDYIGYYVASRSKWNYLSAEVNVINLDLSNKEKERLREKLRDVRFWHDDSYTLSNINYEEFMS